MIFKAPGRKAFLCVGVENTEWSTETLAAAKSTCFLLWYYGKLYLIILSFRDLV